MHYLSIFQMKTAVFMEFCYFWAFTYNQKYFCIQLKVCFYTHMIHFWRWLRPHRCVCVCVLWLHEKRPHLLMISKRTRNWLQMFLSPPLPCLSSKCFATFNKFERQFGDSLLTSARGMCALLRRHLKNVAACVWWFCFIPNKSDQRYWSLFFPSAAFTSFHIVCFYVPFEIRALEVKL